jgi:ankyrin repeat protein
MIRVLFERKADLNARSEFGLTPLCLVSHNRSQTLRFLLDHDPNISPYDGKTPLHEASELGELKIVQLLLGHGVDVDAVDVNVETALQLASAKGHDKVA